MEILERTKFTPNQVAKMWGISPKKILRWIHDGELHAINASAGSQRERYLIDVADLKDFESRRSVRPPLERTRKQQRPADVEEFY